MSDLRGWLRPVRAVLWSTTFLMAMLLLVCGNAGAQTRCNLLSKRVCMWLVQLGLESSIERDGRDGTSKRELTLLHFGNGRL